MRINRRRFAFRMAAVAAVAPAIGGAAALGSATGRPLVIVERRIYAPRSVLPPQELLHRHGIRPASVKRRQDGTAYTISFASAEARVKAWDRFNADEDWRAVRDAGRVVLQEVRVYPGS
jgi:hypothetical protein